MMATAAEEISIHPVRTVHTGHSDPSTEHRPPAAELCLDPLSVTGPRRLQARSWRQRWVYLQCYFLTIATILGTGILGLPVTIAHAGLLPFLVSFLVGFSVQALLIYLFVDLLQRCQVIQLETLKTGVAECIVMSPMGSEQPALTDDDEDDDGENTRADTGLLYPGSVTAPQPQPETLQPHLHLLGRLFLPRIMSHAFNFILLFHFPKVKSPVSSLTCLPLSSVPCLFPACRWRVAVDSADRDSVRSSYQPAPIGSMAPLRVQGASAEDRCVAVAWTTSTMQASLRPSHSAATTNALSHIICGCVTVHAANKGAVWITAAKNVKDNKTCVKSSFRALYDATSLFTH